MITEIINILSAFIISVINHSGYFGVGLLMAIESAAIPLPSEIIMPFSGYLVYEGRFSLIGIAIAGALGSGVGSAVTYYLGKWGGRPLVEKYGKWVLISHHDLELADRFFAKYGQLSTFIGRMLPIVRTFISIPAGIARVSFWPFFINSIIGSFFWSLLLGYVGFKLGPEWATLRERWHWLDVVVAAFILVGGVWWVWRHFKNSRVSR
jgi:membrane protein DedA with SNARE-associated domain